MGCTTATGERPEKGARSHVAFRLYLWVLSCKQAGVDPQPYIEDVLARIATKKAANIATLTPWSWAAAHK